MKLDSKVVVITGSANNIGLAIARKFAGEGACIILNARKSTDKGKQAAEQIQALGAKAIFVQADVSDPEHVDRLFNSAVEKFGTVDLLVNNAGAATPMPFSQSTKEHWLQVFNDNLFSTVLCSIAATKIMQNKRSGKIINTASMRGLEHGGRIGIMAYSAAKAAVINFTKTLAKELAPCITVNAVAPGFTQTSAFDQTPEAIKEQYINGSLIKRWLTVEEVADAFIYLATADGITGEVLVIDGGWNINL